MPGELARPLCTTRVPPSDPPPSGEDEQAEAVTAAATAVASRAVAKRARRHLGCLLSIADSFSTRRGRLAVLAGAALHPAERGSESQVWDRTLERGRNLRAVDINGAAET
ncbi:hypothetical protein GCM10010170_097790 [Dactylosporangium salmoneum]|uniref:Uncharacterized protein n=1 Tax=Dactylosporangium salmoneum TaxID=53361 RepID=A0ABP5USP9_9ACTN